MALQTSRLINISHNQPLSDIIQLFFIFLAMITTERTIIFSTKHQVTMKDQITPDISKDAVFMDLFEQVKPYTMTSVEALFALYTSVNYILDRKIAGDIVECGVWRGGSSLLAALILKARGISDRKLYLYDTFQGMPAPTEFDVDKYGRSGFEMMEQYADEIGWCYALLDEVKAAFSEHHFTFDINFIEGDVIETLKTIKPETISLLRLDTDWYESTALERKNKTLPSIIKRKSVNLSMIYHRQEVSCLFTRLSGFLA